MVKVLFVCSGNICRSPTAEGVFRKLVKEAELSARIEVDSAATGAWHVGETPDARTQEAAKLRGIDLSPIRARQVAAGDFLNFDYILAMDQMNHGQLRGQCPNDMRDKVRLFLDFSDAHPGGNVPDPYYGGEGGFENVLDLVEAGARGLLRHIRDTDF